MRNLCSTLFSIGLLASGCANPDGAVDETSQAVTSKKGLDYSFARPSPSGLHSQGYTFAARYLSYDNSSTHGKILTAAEAKGLIAAGVDVVSNWEYAADDALSGYNAGVNDAKEANAQAAAAGAPAGRPIYFSVDFDATPAQQTPINAYMDGVASVIGRGRTGAYGGYYVIKRLFDAGKISWGWQTYAWSGGQWDARAQVRQVQNGITAAGDGDCCDLDNSEADDFGQWGAAVPPPRGYLDEADCAGIKGWAQDQAAPGSAINVDLYFDAPAGGASSGYLRVDANISRPDLCTAIGSCAHGYAIDTPIGLRDGKAHSVYAYAIAAAGQGPNPLLSDAPKSFTCAPPAMPPPGIKRWVSNPTIFAAWKLSFLLQVAHESPAAVATYPQGANLPDAPLAVIGDDGAPAVWVVDGSQRRHVVNPDSLAAWQLAVAKWPAAKIAALEQGSDWPLVPFVFIAEGQAPVYILDVAPPVDMGGAPPLPAGDDGDGGSAVAAPAATDDGGAGGVGGNGDVPGDPLPGAKHGGCAIAGVGANVGADAGAGDSSTGAWLLALSALAVLARRRKVDTLAR